MGINQSTQTSSVGTFLTFIPLLGGLIVDNEESRAALAQARSDAKAQQTDAFSKEASSTSQKVIKALAAAGIKTISSVTGTLRSIKYAEKVLDNKGILRSAYVVLRDAGETFTIKVNVGHESGQKLIQKLEHVALNAKVAISVFGSYGPNKKEPEGKSYTNYAASVKVDGEEVKVSPEAFVGLNAKVAAVKAMGLSPETTSSETRAVKAKYYAEFTQAVQTRITAERADEAPVEEHAEAESNPEKAVPASTDNFDDDIPF